MKQLRAKDKPRHGAWFELMIEISKINNLQLFAIYEADNCWGVFTDPTDGPGTEGLQAHNHFASYDFTYAEHHAKVVAGMSPNRKNINFT